MSIIIKIINFIESKIKFSKFCSYGTTIFNILDNTTELWMTKYIIGEFFSSGGATLYKNLSDQTVTNLDERGGNGGGRRENMGTTGLSLCVFGGVGTWQNTFLFKNIITSIIIFYI